MTDKHFRRADLAVGDDILVRAWWDGDKRLWCRITDLFPASIFVRCPNGTTRAVQVRHIADWRKSAGLAAPGGQP